MVAVHRTNVRHPVVSVEHDLAVLRTVQPLPHHTTLQDARSGDAVWVIGYPLGGKLAVTRGRIVTEVEGDELQDKDQVEVGKVWQISAKVRSGDSGGPLIGPKGGVVGVVYGYGERSGNGYAIKSDAVKRALDAPGAAPSASCEP